MFTSKTFAVGVASMLVLSLLPVKLCAEGQRPKTVLVPPFENLSTAKSMVTYEVATSSDPNNPKRSFRVDRYTEAPRAVLEDILGSIEGVKIVERQRLDAILLESEFGRLSGLVDPEKAVKLGKLLGADSIIMGSILDVRSTTRDFSGYGIRTRNVQVQSSLRIRVVDIATGKVTYSQIARGGSTYAASNFGGVSDSDVAYAVIEGALEQLRTDQTFKAAMVGGPRTKPVPATAGGDIDIEFAPKPENSDIEIDGQYVGGSPLKRRLYAGKQVRVKISKAGYKTWEAVIMPEPGLRITRELDPESPAKTP
jgi:hypothetical protein